MLSTLRKVSVLSSVSLFTCYMCNDKSNVSSISSSYSRFCDRSSSNLLFQPSVGLPSSSFLSFPGCITKIMKSKLESHCENDPKSKKIDKAIDQDDLPLVYGGSSSKQLAEKIIKLLDIKSGDHSVTKFTDGELLIKVEDFVGKRIVFIIQTCADPVNDSIMELLLTISCAKRAGANKIVAVVPYFGYKHHRRGSVVSTESNSRHLTSSAMDFAKMMQEMGVDRVISVDLQRPGQGQEACFFENVIPLESINTTDFMVRYFIDKIYKEETEKAYSPILVIAPNPESLKKARNFQLSLQKKIRRNVNLAIFNNAEVASGPIDVSRLEMLGKEHKISGSDVIIVDDLIDTAKTLSHLSNSLHKSGARNVYAFASHGLFTDNAMQNIENCHVKKVIVTNSLPLSNHKYVSPKIEQLELENILAHAIKMEYLRNMSLKFEDYENPDDSNIEDFQEYFTSSEK